MTDDTIRRLREALHREISREYRPTRMGVDAAIDRVLDGFRIVQESAPAVTDERERRYAAMVADRNSWRRTAETITAERDAARAELSRLREERDEAREKGREDAWSDVRAEIAALGFKCREHGGQALLCFLAHHARLRRKVARYVGAAREWRNTAWYWADRCPITDDEKARALLEWRGLVRGAR